MYLSVVSYAVGAAMTFSSSGVPTKFEAFMLSEFGVRMDLSESSMLAMGTIAVIAVLFVKAIVPHLTYR